MVRGLRCLTDALTQMMRHALGHPSRVHKYQRRTVLLHQNNQPVVDLVPHLVRSHGSHGNRRNFNRHIEFPLVPDVDDDGLRPHVIRGTIVPVRKCATSSIGFWVAERPMRTGRL